MKKTVYTEGFLLVFILLLCLVVVYFAVQHSLDTYYMSYSDDEIDWIQAQQERFTTEMPVSSIGIGVMHDGLLNATCYVTYNGGISCIPDAQLNRSVK